MSLTYLSSLSNTMYIHIIHIGHRIFSYTRFDISHIYDLIYLIIFHNKIIGLGNDILMDSSSIITRPKIFMPLFNCSKHKNEKPSQIIIEIINDGYYQPLRKFGKSFFFFTWQINSGTIEFHQITRKKIRRRDSICVYTHRNKIAKVLAANSLM